MDFSYSEEQDSIRDLARQIMADRADFELQKRIVAEHGSFDTELWQALAEAGLLGIAIPEEHGGLGFGTPELSLLFEEQGRHLALAPLFASLALGALPVARYGSAEQQRRLLPGVADGTLILSAALAERGIADPAKTRTRAHRAGESIVLDGEKVCVPAADRATRILVPARAEDGALGVFLVDPQARGVALERQTATHGEPVFTLTLASASVQEADVLAPLGRGERVVEGLVQHAQAALCATQLGVAEEALRRTAEYTCTRKQFKKPIGAFQGVALRAADAYIDIEAMRSTLWQAVWRLGAGEEAAKEIATAKWWACRGGQRVVHAAQHLHGGIGADIDYPIHRFFLWSKYLDLTLGSAGQQLERLGALLCEAAA